jgi:hypothetical protein
MPRPTGEVRQALEKAAERLAEERGGATWRDMAEVAQVGYRVAKVTVRDMVRAQALEPVGSAKKAHSRRWMTLYAPRQQQANFATQTTSLEGVTRGWLR